MKLLLVFLVLFSVSAKAETCRITYQADVGATTVSVKMRSETHDRKCLIIQNQGSSVIYIKYDTAHTGTENFQLAGGATFAPIIIPVNAIFIKSAAGSVTTTILEGK